MPSRERLQRQFLELSIITFITVVIWIGYEVYATLTRPVDTNVSAAELQSIPPPLESKKFEPLREKLVIDDETLDSFTLSTSELPETLGPTPTPATPSPEATPSGSAPRSPADVLHELLY
jgi:hypothetical protein